MRLHRQNRHPHNRPGHFHPHPFMPLPFMVRPPDWRRGLFCQWMLMENAVILYFRMTAYKISRHNATRIEFATGTPLSKLNEADLIEVMDRLDIRRLPLSEQDMLYIEMADDEPRKQIDAAKLLQELQRLRAAGVITEEQYANRKEDVLNGDI